MQTTDIEQEICSFLVNNFLFGRADELNKEAPLLGNVIDSTGVVEFVLFLQDRFAITVEDEEVSCLDSLRSAVTLVEQKLQH